MRGMCLASSSFVYGEKIVYREHKQNEIHDIEYT